VLGLVALVLKTLNRALHHYSHSLHKIKRIVALPKWFCLSLAA